MENEKELQTKKPQKSNPYAIPIAIVVAGGLISATIWFANSTPSNRPDGSSTASVGRQLSGSPAINNIKEVSSEDHIRGSIDAPVKLVEFSDLECPFCKRFHATAQQIFKDYNGQVAWVYRHFPLTSLHSKAQPAGEAAECAFKLGGNDAFWAYIDRYFEVTPSNNQIRLDTLPVIAQDIGLDRSQFESCQANDTTIGDIVRSQYEDAVNSGGTGTPFSVVIARDGTKLPIIGAQPYESVRAVIEQALNN